MGYELVNLRKLAITLNKLSNLEVLNLGSNFSDLQELSETIGDLTSLRELDVSNNQLLGNHALFGGREKGTIEYDIKARIMDYINIPKSEYGLVFTGAHLLVLNIRINGCHSHNKTTGFGCLLIKKSVIGSFQKQSSRVSSGIVRINPVFSSNLSDLVVGIPRFSGTEDAEVAGKDEVMPESDKGA
ncbi:hypothetical protein LXL04_028918 [Taraxacum kok-saghyz]